MQNFSQSCNKNIAIFSKIPTFVQNLSQIFYHNETHYNCIGIGLDAAFLENLRSK